MKQQNFLSQHVEPVVIGGVGGSGTRLIAQCLKEVGFHIGTDLNSANDNLWFTLLFKRIRRAAKNFMQWNDWINKFNKTSV